MPDIASCGQWMVQELDRLVRMKDEDPTKAMRSLLNARIAKLLNKYREERTLAGMLGFSADASRPKCNA